MPNITSVMLEITSKCSRRCPLCLPPERRGGVELDKVELVTLFRQFRSCCIKEVTLCGFGSPAEHPLVNEIIWMLGSRLKMSVNIVCRPTQLIRAWKADTVAVSIDCLEDVKTLKRQNPVFWPVVFAHIVMTDRVISEIDEIFGGLLEMATLGGINVVHPMVLCNDEGHQKAVAEANRNLEENESRLFEARKALGEEGARVRYFCPENFVDSCRFHVNMIYIDSDLKVRLCCHQPTLEPLADLRTMTLADAIAGPVAKAQEGWRDHPACQRCPDHGLEIGS